MKRKGLLSLILCIMTINSFAYDFVSNGIYYNIISTEEKTVEVTIYPTNLPSYGGDIVIPETVTNNDVEYIIVGIGASAFYYCRGLSSITLPSNLTYIGDGAFSFTGISSIVIPTSVKRIGASAFAGCASLLSVSIPDGITEIKESTFNVCSSLNTISFPNSLKKIGAYSFGSCPNLSPIIIPESVDTIEKLAFYDDLALTSLKMPEQIKFIGDEAFKGCSNLIEIIFPIGITDLEVGRDAFKETPWYNHQPDGLVYIETFLYGYKGTMPDNSSIEIKNGTTAIGSNVFKNCHTLVSINIPEGVKSIGDAAFQSCTGLTTVVFPNSITKIGAQAFWGCNSINSITLSNSLINIQYGAFVGCNKLKAIVIPDKVKTIGDEVFYDCSSLKQIVIQEGIEVIGTNTFTNTQIRSLTIPSTVISIGSNDNLYLDTLVWNSTVNPEYFGCKTLKYLKCGEGITEIRGFNGCNQLTTVILPESLKTIGYGAFSECSSLTSIHIPSGVHSIEMDAFMMCTNLIEITGGDNITFMDDRMGLIFGNCPWINTLPEGLFYFGKVAYKYIGTIPENTELVIKNGTTQIAHGALSSQKGLVSVKIPESVTHISYGAFSDSGIETITIPEKTTWIEMYAFSGCVNLASIELSSSLPYLEYGTFYGCINLKTIVLPRRLSYIESQAFENCINLSSITLLYPGVVNASIGYDWGSFKGVDLSKCTLYVPEEYVDLYKETAGWNQFANIQPQQSIPFVNNIGYKIISKLEKTVVVVSTKDNSENVSIPSTVTLDGIDYYVTKICYGAFEGSKKLKNVYISEGITDIDEGAFSSCYQLESITIPSSLKYIGRNAFSYNNLKTIITYIVDPTQLTIEEGLTRWEDALDKCVIYVPDTSLEIYKSTDPWSIFNHIEIGSIFKDGLYYGILSDEQKTAILIDLNKMNEINIPDYIMYDNFEYNVVSFKDGLFRNNQDISSIVFSNNILELEEGAFSGCTNLKKVLLPLSLSTIPPNVFRDCVSLDSIYIPDNVNIIGNNAFAGCTGLCYIKIPANVKNIAPKAFAGCSNIISIIVDPANTVYDSREDSNAIIETASNTLLYASNSSFIPTSIKVICENAFEGRTVYTAMDIPEGVIEIKENAFKDCNGIKALTVPTSIRLICNDSFKGCTAIKSLWWGSDVTPYYVTQYCKENLNNVRLNNNITVIGDSAFIECVGITEIVIPDSIRSIGNYAFTGCIGITDLLLPNKLETIKKGAFKGCLGLNELVIPESVLIIMDAAFENCSNIRKLTIPASLTQLHMRSFMQCSNIDTLYWDNSTVLPFLITQFCNSNLKTVILGDDVTQIGDNAFAVCKALSSINIPAGVTTIPTSAFQGCASLIQLSLPEQLTSIGNYAFAQCSALRDIIIPAKVNSIGEKAFAECSSLTSISIPESVTAIGRGAFEECNKISAVSVPSSVVQIDDLAFKGCRIDSVYWNSNIPMRNVLTRYATESLRAVVLGNNVNEISKEEFSGCAVLNDITIPDGVNKIGEKAFYGCNSLKSISLPSSINAIGDNAFDECRNLAVVNCYAVNCPVAELNTFRNVKATAYVPLASVFKYRAESPWSSLNLILPFCFNETEKVVLSNDGYATFFCSYADYELPTGISAYVISGINNGKIVYETLSEGKYGGVIPQGVAVMIKSDKKSAGTYELKFKTSNFTYNGNNLLIGSDVDTITYAYRTSDFYKLTYGPTGTELGTVFGWYWGAEDGDAFRIEGHKAWLATPKQTALRTPSFSITSGAIFIDLQNPATLVVAPEGMFDMGGRKVDMPFNNGLFIIDGKQVLISK